MRMHDLLDVHELDSGITDECERYLQGDYVSWLEREGLRVSPSAHLNRAAYADRSAIGAHLDDAVLPEGAHTFADAALLVEAMLLTADDLGAAQRQVVQPLERLLRHELLSPRAVVQRAAAALFAVD
jgi:hypothetical protein